MLFKKIIINNKCYLSRKGRSYNSDPYIQHDRSAKRLRLQTKHKSCSICNKESAPLFIGPLSFFVSRLSWKKRRERISVSLLLTIDLSFPSLPFDYCLSFIVFSICFLPAQMSASSRAGLCCPVAYFQLLGLIKKKKSVIYSFVQFSCHGIIQ